MDLLTLEKQHPALVAQIEGRARDAARAEFLEAGRIEGQKQERARCAEIVDIAKTMLDPTGMPGVRTHSDAAILSGAEPSKFALELAKGLPAMVADYQGGIEAAEQLRQIGPHPVDPSDKRSGGQQRMGSREHIYLSNSVKKRS